MNGTRFNTDIYSTYQSHNAASGSQAAQSEPLYLMGIDKVLYRKPKETQHRFRWNMIAKHSAEYVLHPIKDAAAGANMCACDPDNFSDQLYTAYVHLRRPGIRGEKGKSAIQYPLHGNPHQKEAEQSAAIRVNSVQSSMMNGKEMLKRGLDAYLAENLGCAGIRRKRDIEATTIASCTTVATQDPFHQKYFAYYTQQWAFTALQRSTVKIGPHVVDTLSNRVHYLLQDMSITESKKQGWREMTGQPPVGLSEQDELAWLIEQSSYDGEAWIPLMPLWHTMHSKKALNSCAADWSPIEYSFQFAPFTAFIRRSTENTRVVKRDGQELTPTDLKAEMCIQHMYLEAKERMKVENGPYDTLVKLHAERQHRTNNSAMVEANIKIAHPTVAVYWVVERDAAVKDNDPFNWWGLFGFDAINSAMIRFSTQPRQAPMPAMFYRLVQAFEKSNATPSTCAYMYGFATDVCNEWPRGSSNFIRYSEVVLCIHLQEQLADQKITIWTINQFWMLLHHENMVIVTAFQHA